MWERELLGIIGSLLAENLTRDESQDPQDSYHRYARNKYCETKIEIHSHITPLALQSYAQTMIHCQSKIFELEKQSNILNAAVLRM